MIQYRRMQKEDLEEVAAIEQQIFSLPWSKQAFEESLDNKNTLFIVAKSEEKIAGYCGIYISFEEGNISNVAVAPAFRRKGIAENMIKDLLKEAAKKGVTSVFLEVRKTNVAAIALYEKSGFREVGVRKDFYDKPKEDALIMWKNRI